jgi:hypothetical protein
MKYGLGFCLVIFSVLSSFAQKIQGVYVGGLFSARNILVLETTDNKVTGTVYVTAKDHFIFTGIYKKHQLEGVIAFSGNKKVPVTGTLEGKSLTLSVTDSVEVRSCTFHKFANKLSVEPFDLFSTHYDMLLLGEWESFKRVDLKGNTMMDRSIIVSYSPLGKGAGRISNNIRRNNRMPMMYNPSNSAAERWTVNWETNDGQLDATEHHPSTWSRNPMNPNPRYLMTYTITGETLVTESQSFGAVYWTRINK